jgi:FAD/FMN-containing dehydrogenase
VLDVIRVGDPRYESFRHTYTATGSPESIIRVRTAGDAAEALAVARAAGAPFAVRSGGHGISSISTNDGGTVIDLSALDSIEKLGETRVRIGPGARWGHVAEALFPWGFALTSGDSGDVGVGGLATTGGIGLLGRRQGLTIDRLRAVDLLTADGTIRRVDATHHADLFWAVRGAGANLGIATAFEFDADTTPVVAHATIAYGLGDVAGFLERWGSVVEAAPRDVSAFLYLGVGFAHATVVVATDETDRASAALAPFADLPGVAGARAQLVPYATIPLTSDAPHRGQQAAHAHSGLVDHLDRASARAIAALVPAVDMVQIRSVGGAINDVPADATAYAHRHQNFSVAAMSTGPRARFDDAWERARPVMDGMYLSFETDHSPVALSAAFPEPTLSRLRAIKQTWDPEGIFSQNFDVTAPAAST